MFYRPNRELNPKGQAMTALSYLAGNVVVWFPWLLLGALPSLVWVMAVKVIPSLIWLPLWLGYFAWGYAMGLASLVS